MKRSLALLVWIAFTAPLLADDGIPPKTLNEIKAATVFIKVTTARGQGTGTGFLMQVDGDKGTGLIVTNEHVVVPPAIAGAVTKIEVVFHSGKAKTETVVLAEVLAKDADRDLAVLRVKKVPETCKPIPLDSMVELAETMTVHALGFPFGRALSTTDGNPSITIGKGSVSSLREDADGKLTVIQIDGDLNPGNSGGPVVDSKGRLIGVAVAKLSGTNIGLAIPAHHLELMLRGRLGATGFRVIGVEKGIAEVELSVQFIDPLDKIKSAKILLAKSGDYSPPTQRPKEIPVLPKAETYELKIANQTGSVRVKVPVESHWMQATYSTEQAKDIRVSIIKLNIPLKAGEVPNTGSTPVAFVPKSIDPALIGELEVKSILIAGKLEPKAGRNPIAVPCLTWADDGKAFFALDHTTNTVRKISYPELKEVATLDIGKQCTWLSLSSEGLIATVLGEKQAWVIDPETLKKSSTFPSLRALRVVSSPKSAHAYVADCDQLGRGALRVVEVKTGKEVKAYESRDLDRMCGLNSMVMSLDGKSIFSASALENMVQLKVDGEKVEAVAISDRLIQGVFVQPVISPDSAFVCAPCGGGNYPTKGFEKIGTYATAVFRVGSLKQPVFHLKTGAYPSAIAFDSKQGLVYAQNHENHIIIMDEGGQKLLSQKLGDPKDNGLNRTVQILPHPDGGKALVLLAGSAFDPVNAYSITIKPKAK